MSLKLCGMSTLVLASLSIAVWGCGSPADTPTSGELEEHDLGHADMDMSMVPKAALDEQAQRINEALAKLSPEDLASVKKQGKCLVTDLELGAMGTPIKLTVEGETVWICCPDCEATLTENPQTYLTKLHELP